MDTETLVVFFIILMMIVYYIQLHRNNNLSLNKKFIDNSGHVKPEHLLYDVLKQFSSGDKITLTGQCRVNLYTKDIIDVDSSANLSSTHAGNTLCCAAGLANLEFLTEESFQNELRDKCKYFENNSLLRSYVSLLCL